jgi:hypothetical protein
MKEYECLRTFTGTPIPTLAEEKLISAEGWSPAIFVTYAFSPGPLYLSSPSPAQAMTVQRSYRQKESLVIRLA